MPYYHLILPVAGTNLVSNPSLELNATGWAGTVSANINRTAGTATFGAWAAAGTPAAGANSGITYGTPSLAAGSYTVSAYVFGGSGSVYSIGVKGTGAGAAFVGSVIGTTGGTWHRYSFSYNEAALVNRLFAVVKRTAGVDPFFVDGAQIESGTFQTTHIDGDQDGCTWLGQSQASQSSRSGTSRQGGTVVSLQSLGLTVLEAGAVGMPPVSNITQEYAIADGALWQRQRATSRVFTLTSLMSGTTWPGLHAIRQTVIDAIKIDRTPNPQPFRLLYTGAGGTATIDAYYDGGMTMESRSGFSETTALRFMAPDPYWYATTDDGTALKSQVNLGSVNSTAQRSPIGVWGSMGVNGTSLHRGGDLGSVWSMALMPGGTLAVGGLFGTAGGTLSGDVAFWSIPAGQWGTFPGGTVQGAVVSFGFGGIFAMDVTSDGTLLFGGFLTSVAGTATKAIAYWAGQYGTLPGVLPTHPSDIVYALKALPGGSILFGGSLFLTGSYQYLGMWQGGASSLPTGGTPNDQVFAMTRTPSGAVVYGGIFTAANGTAAGGIASWSDATGTLGIGVGPASSYINVLAYGPNGILYAGGHAGTWGVSVTPNAAQWNGNQWTNMAAGLGTFSNSNVVYGVAVDARGNVYMGGSFARSGSVTFPDEAAFWNGATWLPLDIDFPGAGRINTIIIAPDNTLFIGGGFGGTALAAGVTTIINEGAANVYPVVTFRNTSASNQRIYQVLNTATNDGIWLNTSILPGEFITLDLRNGAKTLISDYRGNMLGAVMPGSNLTTWKLVPGTNYVSVFAASGSVETSIYWRGRAWSADSRL